MSNMVLSRMSKWFICNKLVLNLDKTNIIKFMTNHYNYDLKIGYDEKCIKESKNTKFLGLQTHKYINWKNHIHLMISKVKQSLLCN
jgi:hypothetical protein